MGTIALRGDTDAVDPRRSAARPSIVAAPTAVTLDFLAEAFLPRLNFPFFFTARPPSAWHGSVAWRRGV